MYNYSFRPTFPVYQRSSQVLLVLGFGGAFAGIAATLAGYGSIYKNLPFVVLSLTAFFGFIIQYVRYDNFKERGFFFVVDLNGFHSYLGRHNDIQMRWENVKELDRTGNNMVVEDIHGKIRYVNMAAYSRIDRLRIECLMHQFLMFQRESKLELVPDPKFATVA